MLDINLFRVSKGGNPDLIKESQRKRGASVEIVDEIIDLDNQWVKARFNADAINKDINAINKQIGAFHKAKKPEEAKSLIPKKADLEAQKKVLNEQANELEKKVNEKLNTIGNIIHETVPDSLTEDDNLEVRRWWPTGRSEEEERARRIKLVGTGSVKDGAKGVPGLYSHHEVLERLDGYDAARGTNVAGHRGFFLTNVGVELNLALIQYGLSFLKKRGYKKIQTPFFMKRDVMAKTAQLSDFDEELYKVSEVKDDPEPKYLIATSEQPISAFHSGEWFSEPEKQLPIRYAGYSTCFRKEAGAHGKDTWGLFRIHQFEKIEQFILCQPEKSWEELEQLIKTSEEFYQTLKLPYHVIAIVSGALNNAAAKKYDLEAYFPFQAEYKELVSCSNCTDYQSRNLDIRLGVKKMNSQVKNYVHLLNGTLCATERTLCCILENYQTEEGLIVPEPLRPYMDGVEFIPFVKELASDKKGGKGKKN